MYINKINLPLYKLRSYISLEKNPLGVTWVTTPYGRYVLDDDCYKGTFTDRRIQITRDYKTEQIYTLKERVFLLRQLVKYPGGTKFIDIKGNIIQYKKGNKMFDIESKIIVRKSIYKDNHTVIYCMGEQLPFYLSFELPPTATHASIMDTQWGPFLYDITSSSHQKYRKKL